MWRSAKISDSLKKQSRILLVSAVGMIFLLGFFVTIPGAEAATSSLPGRVSVSSMGIEANAGSGMSSISADGNYIAFISDASNLVPEDINNVTDVFIADSHTGDIRLVSTDSNGSQGNCGSLGPSISADGRYVAFVSCASNLVPGDTNGDPDIFLKDIQTGTTTRVSTDSGGNQANPTLYQNGSNACTISGDGRYVAFQSFASNLVSGDTNSTCDVFIKDTQINQTTRVSTDSAGHRYMALAKPPLFQVMADTPLSSMALI